MALSLEKNDSAVKLNAISKLFNTTGGKKDNEQSFTNLTNKTKSISNNLDTLVSNKLSNVIVTDNKKSNVSSTLVSATNDILNVTSSKTSKSKNNKFKDLIKSAANVISKQAINKKNLINEIKSDIKFAKTGLTPTNLKKTLETNLMDKALKNTTLLNAIVTLNKELCSNLNDNNKTIALTHGGIGSNANKSIDKLLARSITDLLACPLDSDELTKRLVTIANKKFKTNDPESAAIINGMAASLAKHEKINISKIGKSFLKTETGKKLKKSILTNAKAAGKLIVNKFKYKKDKTKKDINTEFIKDSEPELISKSNKPNNKPKSDLNYTLADAIKDNVKSRQPIDSNDIGNFNLSETDKYLLAMGSMSDKKVSNILAG